MSNLKEKAFTLIELLVIVAIIGILATIAISGFSRYRQRGNDAVASQDLRNTGVAEEAQYVDTATYIACSDRADCISKLIGIENLSNNTTISITADAGISYEGIATSVLGSGKTFLWGNLTGQQVIQ